MPQWPPPQISFETCTQFPMFLPGFLIYACSAPPFPTRKRGGPSTSSGQRRQRRPASSPGHEHSRPSREKCNDIMWRTDAGLLRHACRLRPPSCRGLNPHSRCAIRSPQGGQPGTGRPVLGRRAHDCGTASRCAAWLVLRGTTGSGPALGISVHLRILKT